MFGQGSPPTSPSPRARFAPRCGLIVCAVIVCLAMWPTIARCQVSTNEQHNSVRIRIAWGGGAAAQWHGSIELSEGSITSAIPLGVDADETGSIHVGGSRLAVRQRSPRSYDGVDFLVTASPDASVTVRLWAADARYQRNYVSDPPADELKEFFAKQFTIAELVSGVVDSPIGDQGHRMLAMRSPGDALRVEFAHGRDLLVCTPGETLDFTVHPNQMPIAAGTKLRFRAQLNRARGGDELWSDEVKREVAEGGNAEAWPLAVKLPDQPGVYDIQITAYAWGLREKIIDPTKRLGLGAPLVSRTVQVVLFDSKPADRAVVEAPVAPLDVVVELDPANPSWWTRFIAMPQLRKWSLVPKSSWDHGSVARWQHPELHSAMRLEPGSWEALPLPIEQLGMPHIVEVEYPSDMIQSLGISILDPNAAGELVPVGLDSGVYVEAPVAAPDGAKWLKHRLVFWPRTKTPLALLVNRDGSRPAVHGKIRILAGPQQLPAAHPHGEMRPERLLAGYLERPLLAENFSASEVRDPFSGRSLDDWVTFYEATTRLAEYLDFAGYGGVMAAVASEGSTIYPSRVLEPTPKSDTGVFFSTGNDPFRKDALELLLRVFDHRSLTLIPAVQFSTPLPALEKILAERATDVTGIVPIGRDGLPSRTDDAKAAGGAPYYNPLDERVQKAMLDVIAELVDRYGEHPSLGGLAIQLSADGYGVLPGIEWSLDDVTWAAYERATGQSLGAVGPDRYARRATAVLGPQRAAWLAWRAERLVQFQRRAAAIVARAGQDLRLYVSAASVWDSPAVRDRMRPNLTRATKVDDALLTVGIDVESYRRADMASVVFMRPSRHAPPTSLNEQAADIALNQSLELDRSLTVGGPVASVFYHPPSRLRLPTFDGKSPVGADKTYTWLAAQMSPGGMENRRRFVHALATGDAVAMFDGGAMLPLGQEDSVRDLVDVYRRLPAARFDSVEDAPRPVTIRVRSEHRRTLAYVVNDSPWRITLDVEVTASPRCRAISLSPNRHVPELTSEAGTLRWRVALEPYDVIASIFTEPGVTLGKATVEIDAAVAANLRRQVDALGERALRLAKSPAYDKLANAGFEQPTMAGTIPGWTINAQQGVTIMLGGAAAEGEQAATITSAGRNAFLTSEWFAVPQTGRLAVLVALRTTDAAGQPPLRVALESSTGRVRYWPIAVGAAPANVPLKAEWSEFLFPFDALPTSPGTEIRVRFDMLGAGEARVDDVRLLHLSLSPDEKAGLGKIVSLANLYVRDSQWADCAGVLDGYWPRFIEQHVPLDAPLQARREQPASETPTADAGREDAPSERVIDRLKKKLKPF